jgi:hypothetical protein
MTPEHWLLAGLLLGLVAQGVALLRLARHVRGLERRCRDLTIGLGRLREWLTTSGRPPEQAPEQRGSDA